MKTVPPLSSYTRTLGQVLAAAEPRRDGTLSIPPDVDVPPWIEATLAELGPRSPRSLVVLSRAVAAVERGDTIHAFVQAMEIVTPAHATAFFADANPTTLALIDAVCSERAPTSAMHLASLCLTKEATEAYGLVKAAVTTTRDLHADELARGLTPIDLPSELFRPRVTI